MRLNLIHSVPWNFPIAPEPSCSMSFLDSIINLPVQISAIGMVNSRPCSQTLTACCHASYTLFRVLERHLLFAKVTGADLRFSLQAVLA
jgi:hypothetical protein